MTLARFMPATTRTRRRARSAIVGTCATVLIAADNRHNRTRFVVATSPMKSEAIQTAHNCKISSEISDPPSTLISPVLSTVRFVPFVRWPD